MGRLLYPNPGCIRRCHGCAIVACISDCSTSNLLCVSLRIRYLRTEPFLSFGLVERCPSRFISPMGIRHLFCLAASSTGSGNVASHGECTGTIFYRLPRRTPSSLWPTGPCDPAYSTTECTCDL